MLTEAERAKRLTSEPTPKDPLKLFCIVLLAKEVLVLISDSHFGLIRRLEVHQEDSDLDCWALGFTPSFCCDLQLPSGDLRAQAPRLGPAGNEDCWDGPYTFDACCQGLRSLLLSQDGRRAPEKEAKRAHVAMLFIVLDVFIQLSARPSSPQRFPPNYTNPHALPGRWAASCELQLLLGHDRQALFVRRPRLRRGRTSL